MKDETVCSVGFVSYELKKLSSEKIDQYTIEFQYFFLKTLNKLSNVSVIIHKSTI